MRPTRSNQDARAWKARLFTFPFAWLEGLLLPARPDPLEPGGARRVSLASGQRQVPRLLRAKGLYAPVRFPSDLHAGLTTVLKVSSSSSKPTKFAIKMRLLFVVGQIAAMARIRPRLFRAKSWRPLMTHQKVDTRAGG